ncbi:YncE family protein [Streptomyces sp. B1866]|uniref:YncE family protein n=1 Tax=Streptomyces sp. B1866 TaxID=3075431 RepID=UPI00288F4C9B|nr:YncE family protein [Streptomyces sp. B1866]MDT3397144.1 YncE family protein [Streptomyces sp. B1866]
MNLAPLAYRLRARTHRAVAGSSRRPRWPVRAVVSVAAAGLVAASGLVSTGATTAAAATLPGCQTTAPGQKTLDGVRTASRDVPAAPFGLAYAPSGPTAFVTLKGDLGVLATDSFPPRLVRRIPLPVASLGGSGATGLALTHDGRYLLAATGSGAIVVDAAKAAAGTAGAVLGTLTGTAGTSAIQVALSPDDRYAFVTQEYGNSQTGDRGGIEVFDLSKAVTSGFPASAYVGSLTLGKAVVGVAVSPDGRRVYATSQLAPDGSGPGLLSVADLATLETAPGRALLGSVPAGCNPVRVAAAPDGATVWVTARQSNALLAFDAARLTADPGNALLTSVQVGTAPVGLAFTGGGSRIVTADSNRFAAEGAVTGLTVVDTQAALQGAKAGLGRIPTGAFPRELALSPDGRTLLVSDFGSRQVRAVDVTTLP